MFLLRNFRLDVTHPFKIMKGFYELVWDSLLIGIFLYQNYKKYATTVG